MAAAVEVRGRAAHNTPLDNSRLNKYRSPNVPGIIARELKQERGFRSPEQEAFLGLQIVAARVAEPWEKFLKVTAKLTPNQYNVLRILRGSGPSGLPCGEIADRMIARDPDVTRLVDRLSRRGLARRLRSRQDRRVVEISITEKGQQVLRKLDDHVNRMPQAMLGHLGSKKLEQLSELIGDVITGLGTFP